MFSNILRSVANAGRREPKEKFAPFEPERPAEPRRRRRPPRSAILVAAVLAGSGASVYFAWKDSETPPSGLPRVPFLDATPGGERQRESDRYRETLEAANEINANAADSRGDSFVSVPEATLEELVTVPPKEQAPWKRELPEKLPARQEKIEAETPKDIDFATAPAPEAIPKAALANPAPAEENPYLNLVLGQMSALSKAMAIAAPASQELTARDSRAGEAAATADPASEAASIDRAAAGMPGIPAGEILYAETLTAVDSRRQTPVAAVVVQGPLAKSRLIGGFSTHAGARGLYLEFSGFVDPDGDFHEIEAVAIDGFTASAAVASDVEDSLLSRLGPELAATFVADFANHAALPGQTAIEVGGEAAIVYDKPGIRDSLFAGIGAAASQIKSDLRSTAGSNPVISLRAGYPIGVLFLKPLERGEND